MDNDQLLKLIENKFPYNTNKHTGRMGRMREGLEKMSPIIKRCLVNFLETGKIEEINLLGYSVEILKEKHGMTELAAYLTLDWLIREPDKAVKSLLRGHDVVGTAVNNWTIHNALL